MNASTSKSKTTTTATPRKTTTKPGKPEIPPAVAPATDAKPKPVDFAEVVDKLLTVKPKDLENLSCILDGLLKQYEQQEGILPPEDDTAYLTDRDDLLGTADEYFLSVVTSDHDLESDEDYEYRDLADFKFLVDEGLLELERTEIRTSGATVDIYTLTAKGRAEIETTPEAPPVVVSDDMPPTDQRINPDEYLQPIERLSRYVLAHCLIGSTGHTLFEEKGLSIDDQWETVHFLFAEIRDGIRHGFAGIHSADVNHAQMACEDMLFV